MVLGNTIFTDQPSSHLCAFLWAVITCNLRGQCPQHRHCSGYYRCARNTTQTTHMQLCQNYWQQFPQLLFFAVLPRGILSLILTTASQIINAITNDCLIQASLSYSMYNGRETTFPSPNGLFCVCFLAKVAWLWSYHSSVCLYKYIDLCLQDKYSGLAGS